MESDAASEWSEYHDQQDVLVTFHRAARNAFPSLEAFFEARVQASFAGADKARLASDVRKYLERVCEIRPITGLELRQYVADHAGWSRRPEIPPAVQAAKICRDEPDTKEVIWETDDAYWHMSWGRDRWL